MSLLLFGEIRGQGEKGSYDASAGAFIYPVIQYISRINARQLICKLTVRDVQRGRYKFVEALEKYYVR